MTYRGTMVAEHPVRAKCDEILNLILSKEAEFDDKKDGTDLCSRIQLVIESINIKLNTSLLDLIPLSTLHNLISNMNSLPQNIAQFISNENRNEIDNILDTMLVISSQIPQVTNDTIAVLESEIKLIIENHRKNIREQEKQLQFIEEGTKSINVKLVELNDTIGKEKIAASDVIKNFNLEATVFKEKRVSELEDEKNSILKKAASIITELEEAEQRVNELVGVVTNTSQSGHYTTRANEENKIANKFRAFSLGLMAFLVLMCLLIIIYSFHNFQWSEVLSRILMSFVLAVPILYTMNESAKHRKIANKYTDTALQLAALDPYLQGLGDGEKLRIKQQLVAKYFGNSDEITLDKLDPLVSGLMTVVSKLGFKQK